MSGQRPHPWLPLAAAVLLMSGVFGCQPDCGEKQEITYDQGITNEAKTEYQTTPFNGPLLHFPPQRIYRLKHGLRAEPTHVDVNLSFAESGGNLAPSSGNQSLWHVHDEGIIWVKNDSCAEFYVHVFASTDLPADPADAGSD
jgi:hypothetical protein